MKTGFPICFRVPQTDVDTGKLNAVAGARIEIVDSNGQATGKIYESGAAGQAPTQSAAFSGAKATITDFSLPSMLGVTPLPFNVNVFDTAGYHSTTTNNTRFTAPVTGYYRVGGRLTIAANETGPRALGHRINGTTQVFLFGMFGSTADFMSSFTEILLLNATDYVEIIGFQISGINLNASGAGEFIFVGPA